MAWSNPKHLEPSTTAAKRKPKLPPNANATNEKRGEDDSEDEEKEDDTANGKKGDRDNNHYLKKHLHRSRAAKSAGAEGPKGNYETYQNLMCLIWGFEETSQAFEEIMLDAMELQ